jgi:hypothetical protein
MQQQESDEREQRRKAREQEKIRARKPQRATYDLPPALRQRVKELAEEQRLPASQLVALALLRLLADHDAGRVRLSRYKQPSRSPRYDWNLEYPPDLLAVLKRRK